MQNLRRNIFRAIFKISTFIEIFIGGPEKNYKTPNNTIHITNIGPHYGIKKY